MFLLFHEILKMIRPLLDKTRNLRPRQTAVKESSLKLFKQLPLQVHASLLEEPS